MTRDILANKGSIREAMPISKQKPMFCISFCFIQSFKIKIKSHFLLCKSKTPPYMHAHSATLFFIYSHRPPFLRQTAVSPSFVVSEVACLASISLSYCKFYSHHHHIQPSAVACKDIIV